MNPATSSDLTSLPTASNPYFGWALPMLRYVWTQAPKRGLTCYGGLLLVLLLWIAPKAFETGSKQVNIQPQSQTEPLVEPHSEPYKEPYGAQHMPSSVALPIAIIAAAGAGFVAEKLTEYSVILSVEQDAVSEQAVELDAANTSVRRTRLKADVAHTQHQIYEALPPTVAAQLRPTPKQQRQSAEEEARDLANAIAGNLKVKGKNTTPEDTVTGNTLGNTTSPTTSADSAPSPANTSPDPQAMDLQATGHTASCGVTIAAGNPEDYRYYQGNIRGKKSLCIDLNNARSYCGLPIVDLADDIARNDKTCFFIGITGSGKSQLTARTIGLAHKRKPLTDGAVITHKSPNKRQGEVFNYAGLEASDEYWIVAGEAIGSYELHQEIADLKSFVARAIGDLKHGRSYD